MFNQVIKQVGKKVVRKAAAKHARPGGFLDLRLGWMLLRDRRVPVASKLAALGIGIALTGALVAVEAPLEALLGIFVPFLGIAADMMIDGLEIVVLPLVFACFFLPRITPRQLVEAVADR